MGEKRKVTIGLVSYTDENGVPQTARLGDEVELGEKDLARLERLGAVGGVDDEVEVPELVPAPKPPVDPAEAGKLLDEKPKARSSSAKSSG